jgi:hypothetical protein
MGWLSVPERQSDARNFEVVSTKYQEGKDDVGKAGDMEKGSAGLALIPAFGEYSCDTTAELELKPVRRSSSIYPFRGTFVPF